MDSRFIDYLIGPYPEFREVYRERSPIHAVDRFSRPVIFFQGKDDLVVRPNQTELMVEALVERGVPVAYVPFEGEGHGFRGSQSIQRSLEAELFFYSRILGFDLTEDIEPVTIENL
jgi:dipeptidyl aminopeptidase/acylaminoacyl peptidase